MLLERDPWRERWMAEVEHTLSGTPDLPSSRISCELEKQREAAARLLRRLAISLRSIPAREKVHTATEKVQQAAHYVQQHYLKDARAQLERLAKRRPAVSMLAAAIAGYVVGRAIRGVLQGRNYGSYRYRRTRHGYE